jgi:hypothetical protein
MEAMTAPGTNDRDELAAVAARLQDMRRHLDTYEDKTTAWPTKPADWDADLELYDHELLAAGDLLGVPPPRVGDRPRLTPRERAILEERLAAAGVDVRGEAPG